MAQRDIEDDMEIEKEDEEQDETRALIRRFLDEAEGTEGDDEAEGALDPLPEEKDSATVSVEDGLDIIDRARTKRDAEGRFVKTATASDAKDADAAAQDEAPAQEEAAPAAQAAAPDDIAALLDGLPDDRKAAIQSRLSAGGELADVFTPYAEQMKAHGSTPKEAMQRLLQINDYATRNPDQYLAWAAGQLGEDKAVEVITKAAERLGLKVVATAEAEDDPFEDEAIKAIKAENRALKARLEGPAVLGPDAPEEQQVRSQRAVEQDLSVWKDAKDAAGKPLRPFFELLAPQIAAKVQEQVQATKRNATMADVERIYGELEGQIRAVGGFAAQTPAPVPQNTQQKAASPGSVERARAASKNIDGTGQGASRRPALPEGANLRDILSTEYDRLTQG